MSQFRYLNELNSLDTIDTPLTKGPVPRWRRRQDKAGGRSGSGLSASSPSLVNAGTGATSSTSILGNSGNTSAISNLSRMSSKTPSKFGTEKRLHNRTPLRRTPSGHQRALTPSGGDRFIPMRSAINFEAAHYMLMREAAPSADARDGETFENAAKQERQRVLCELMTGVDLNKHRILSFQKKAPAAPVGFQNPMRVLYSQAKTPAMVKSSRYISTYPDRILDAPDIIDDFYLNLVDWSPNNQLAVALGSFIYIWNAESGTISELCELPANDYVCSVSWIQEGDHLAVGRTNGTVELWDCAQMKRLRVMDGHSARVGALAWNSYIVSSGSRTGHILHHDVRSRVHKVGMLSGHTGEICGLKWSPDGKYLGSGANDNLLNIWQSSGNATATTPLYTLNQHQAAVKALAWCPWQPHILASGGGTADRHIRFWNCNTGACLNAVDTKSQVCALNWSVNYKELISGHGYANNQVTIWKYPSMTRVAELNGHTARVLHLSMSPDGNTVLSAGADETLRLWTCFTKQVVKGGEGAKKKAKVSALRQCIR